MHLELMKDCTLRGGEKGLCKDITAITIVEAPDIADWIYGEEILLTTLYGVTKSDMTAESFFEKLCQKGISALMVKTGRAVDALSQDMVELSERYQVPLVELPFQVRYIDIVTEGTKQILHDRAQKLNYYLMMQDELTQLMLSGASTQTVVDFLGCHINGDVKVLGKEGNILFEGEKGTNSGRTSVFQLPIRCFGETEGYLAAFGENPLSEEHRTVLNNAANIIAMDFMGKIYAAQTEQKYIDDFLDDLLDGHIESASLRERLSRYGWAVEDRYLVVQVMASQESKTMPDRIAARAISRQESDLLVRRKGDMYRVLKRFGAQEKEDACQQFCQKLAQYQNQKIASGEKRLIIGVSAEAMSAEEIAQAAKQAEQAIGFARIVRSGLVKYDELGVLRLFGFHSDEKELEQVIPNSIRKLAEYDARTNSDLIETLDAYFSNSGNLSRAAKELFIHYKTMLYRMERIREVGEFSPDNPKERLEAELGIKIYRFLHQKG